MREHAIDNPADLFRIQPGAINSITVVRDNFMISVVEIMDYIISLYVEADPFIYP
jgi:hypothetical protein